MVTYFCNRRRHCRYDFVKIQVTLTLMLAIFIRQISRPLLTIGLRYLQTVEANRLIFLKSVLGPNWICLVIGEEFRPQLLRATVLS